MVSLRSSLRKDRRNNQASSTKRVSFKLDAKHDHPQARIARFFYENGIDFSAVDSPSFRDMMTANTGQMPHNIPDAHDLNKSLLQETLQEVRDYVKKVKESWAVTGCSILLDAWVDQEGHDLVTFIADSPAGPIYLKSFDVSDIKGDTNALFSLVDGLVDEVGRQNVVQIIADTTSGWVGELGKSFENSYSNVFWSVSVSHCIDLMLVEIGKVAPLEEIRDNVSKIAEYINKNPLVMKLVQDHIPHGIESMTTSSSEIVLPFLTLERIFTAKSGLVAMFRASKWEKLEDFEISKMVKDSSFWGAVERVVKCTSALIHGLPLFSAANSSQHVEFIYDTIDCIKESIAKEFNGEKECYQPFWTAIDGVWEKHLHSPLHAAGYFLNPTFFYSTGFLHDSEVTTGFASSLVHMVKDNLIQRKATKQSDMYRLGRDCFDEASQADQITGISPTEWWAKKASRHPELQSFAIRVLSQTCEGGSKYKLKRCLAEKLLVTEGVSRKHMEELAFVHYNLHLQRCNKSKT